MKNLTVTAPPPEEEKPEFNWYPGHMARAIREIKEKLKLELNEFLEKNKIEGKALEIYINYLMAS